MLAETSGSKERKAELETTALWEQQKSLVQLHSGHLPLGQLTWLHDGEQTSEGTRNKHSSCADTPFSFQRPPGSPSVPCFSISCTEMQADWPPQTVSCGLYLFLICLLNDLFFFSRATMCFPGGSDGKESACNAEEQSSIPGSGRYPGEGNGYPLQ